MTIRVTLTLDVADGTHPLEWDWATLLDLGPDETVKVESGSTIKLTNEQLDTLYDALYSRESYLESWGRQDYTEEEYEGLMARLYDLIGALKPAS